MTSRPATTMRTLLGSTPTPPTSSNVPDTEVAALRGTVSPSRGDTWRITGGLASAINGWVRVEETVRSPTRKVATAGREGARLSMRRMVYAPSYTPGDTSRIGTLSMTPGMSKSALPPGAPFSVKRNSAPGSILSMGATEKRSIFRPGGGATATLRPPMSAGSA